VPKAQGLSGPREQTWRYSHHVTGEVEYAKPLLGGRKPHSNSTAGHASIRAQTQAPVAEEESTQLEEVVVTAEKRFREGRDVPMSITAVTADNSRSRGVVAVSDLTKLVPGFTYQPSDYGTPIYTIRGIGFKDVAVAVSTDRQRLCGPSPPALFPR